MDEKVSFKLTSTNFIVNKVHLLNHWFNYDISLEKILTIMIFIGIPLNWLYHKENTNSIQTKKSSFYYNEFFCEFPSIKVK